MDENDAEDNKGEKKEEKRGKRRSQTVQVEPVVSAGIDIG